MKYPFVIHPYFFIPHPLPPLVYQILTLNCHVLFVPCLFYQLLCFVLDGGQGCLSRIHILHESLKIVGNAKHFKFFKRQNTFNNSTFQKKYTQLIKFKTK